MAVSKCCQCNGAKAKCVRCACSKQKRPCSSCLLGKKGGCLLAPAIGLLLRRHVAVLLPRWTLTLHLRPLVAGEMPHGHSLPYQLIQALAHLALLIHYLLSRRFAVNK